MSELVIKSGDSGDTAKVSAKGRVNVDAITQAHVVDASLSGDAFFLSLIHI